MEIIHLTLT